jgi:L-iditol 2-dehydrogenase
MKAALYYDLDDIRVEEVPKPEIGSDEILVEMKACGVCGSDLMEWYLRSRAPLVLGHEPTGVVVDVGDGVENFDAGDRVFVHHHVACLTCHYCIRGDYTMCEEFAQTNIHPGGFAEYFRVPAPNVQMDTLKIPNDLSFEEATLIEPIGCCLRASSKCDIQPGDTVGIIGAGPSGIIHIMLAKLRGAGQVIASDFVDYRLDAAKRFGADFMVNPQSENLVAKVRETTGGTGADVVIVTAPNIKALISGMEICRRGGTVLIFAPAEPEEVAHMKPHRLFFSETKVVTSYSTSHIETRRALRLISTGRIKADGLITHKFPLGRIQEAFTKASKDKECLKVVVTSAGV